MKILVTGGKGFIGSSLVHKLLLQQKHTIGVLDNKSNFINNPKYYRRNLKHRSKYFKSNADKEYEVDIRDRREVKKALDDFRPDIVVHLAGIPMARPPENHAPDMVDINFQGTINVFDVFEQSSYGKRFVYTSSSMAYGHFRQSPQKEDVMLFPINAYGAAKAAGEYFVSLSKKDWVIVRPTSVYGFTDCANRVTQLLIDAAVSGKKAWVVKGESLDFSYIEDVVDGFLKCIFSMNALSETFNISRGESRLAADFANELKKYFPKFKFDVREPTSQQVFRGALDISKARTLLQYEPRYSMEQGIRETLRLMQEFDKITIPGEQP